MRRPPLGEPPHVVFACPLHMSQQALREVLHDAEVPRREDVRAPQAAQKSDLGSPPADAAMGGQALDRGFVGKGRELRLGELAVHEGAGEAANRESLRTRKPEAAQPRECLGGQRLGRRERDERFATEPRGPAVGERELAADVVSEVKIDLLREDGRHQGLPERRHPGAPQTAKGSDRGREDRIRRLRPVEGADPRRGPQSLFDDAKPRGAGRPSAGRGPFEAHREGGPRGRALLRHGDQHSASADRKEPPVRAAVEAVDDLRDSACSAPR